jgi:pentatricopeptide repeat protein
MTTIPSFGLWGRKAPNTPCPRTFPGAADTILWGITYNATISACEKGGQWETAVDLLAEMRARGIEPDVITYSATISACEKGGQWEKAVELFEEMRARGIVPNVITYNATIEACMAANEHEHAVRLYSAAFNAGLLSHRTPHGDTMDFHGEFNSSTAKAAVLFLLQEYRDGAQPIPEKGLTLITGRGLHSGDDVNIQIKPALLELLGREPFAGLGAKEHPTNPGRVVIGSAALHQWLAGDPAPAAAPPARGDVRDL